MFRKQTFINKVNDFIENSLKLNSQTQVIILGLSLRPARFS